MSTTTDQKLTGTEVVQEAKALGFTQVEVAGGWWILNDWLTHGPWYRPTELRDYALITTGGVTRIQHGHKSWKVR